MERGLADGDRPCATLKAPSLKHEGVTPSQRVVYFPHRRASNGESPLIRLPYGLSARRVRVFMDNKIHVDYTLKVSGNSLKGKGAADSGGKKQEFDIEGKREKKDK